MFPAHHRLGTPCDLEGCCWAWQGWKMQVSSSAEPPLLMFPLYPQGSARRSPCCSSLEAKGRTGARRASFKRTPVPQRYQDCILEVALPRH